MLRTENQGERIINHLFVHRSNSLSIYLWSIHPFIQKSAYLIQITKVIFYCVLPSNLPLIPSLLLPSIKNLSFHLSLPAFTHPHSLLPYIHQNYIIPSNQSSFHPSKTDPSFFIHQNIIHSSIQSSLPPSTHQKCVHPTTKKPPSLHLFLSPSIIPPSMH